MPLLRWADLVVVLLLIFTTLKPAKNNKLRTWRSLCEALRIIYFSVSNNAATKDLAENGRKSSIFSPTPIKRIGT